MQDKALFEEFIRFCDSQPKDKEINHDLWCTCAVGEFLISKGIEMGEGSYTYNTPEISLTIGASNDGLWGRLDCRDCPNTYGEFTEFLKSYL
jgi:hypothetical protein